MGTDGSDFAHRERVAPHYLKTTNIKKKFKPLVTLQALCLVSVLATAILLYPHPPLMLAVCGYLCGLPAIHFGLRRNSIVLVNIYGTCCVLLGVFPVSFILYKTAVSEAGLEITNVFLAVQSATVLLLNVIGAYLSKELMTLWAPNK